MSYQNELTPQQVRNFRRRARFTLCGEPADVFTEPAPYDGALLFVTTNHNAETGATWLEATSYTYYEDGTQEIGPQYLADCRKADKDTARHIISTEARLWSHLPEGTITGWSPAQIAAEAERIKTI